jgi:hypothetical protein
MRHPRNIPNSWDSRKYGQEIREIRGQTGSFLMFCSRSNYRKRSVCPQVLSHNPLTLLHNALSEGLHELTDEECLTLARSIRVVLVELAERISTALKEEAQLKSAVSQLLNRKPKQN